MRGTLIWRNVVNPWPASFCLVGAFVLNVWLCVRNHVNHDMPEADRLTALSHSVYIVFHLYPDGLPYNRV